jgi:HK97 gp10 family phage protein
MPSAFANIHGFQELEEQLKTLGPKLARKAAGPALKKAGQHIVDYAKTLAPVDTGRLEDSIVIQLTPTRGKTDNVQAVIGFKKPRSRIAHLLEYGTSKQPPQPFMRPAIDAKGEGVITSLGHELWAGILRETNKLQAKR